MSGPPSDLYYLPFPLNCITVLCILPTRDKAIGGPLEGLLEGGHSAISVAKRLGVKVYASSWRAGARCVTRYIFNPPWCCSAVQCSSVQCSAVQPDKETKEPPPESKGGGVMRSEEEILGF
jgi:hypothetical protein